VRACPSSHLQYVHELMECPRHIHSINTSTDLPKKNKKFELIDFASEPALVVGECLPPVVPCSQSY